MFDVKKVDMKMVLVPLVLLGLFVPRFECASVPLNNRNGALTPSSSMRGNGPGMESSAAGMAPIGSQEQIFVCTNKWCREKGSDATMATLSFLANPIPIVPVGCLGRCNKGPNVRVLTKEPSFRECTSVRSVDAVVSLLQEILDMEVNLTSAEVLKLNYEGNVYLRDGEVDKAIESYSSALVLGDSSQEGVLLIMRGSALLQRAYSSRLKYKGALQDASERLPSLEDIKAALTALSALPSIVRAKTSMNLLLGAAKVYRKEVDKDGIEINQKWSDLRDSTLQLAFMPDKEIISSMTISGKEKDKRDEKGDGGKDKGEGKRLSDNLPSVPELLTREPLDQGPNEAGLFLGKASFSFSLYEHSLTRALEDLLRATVVLPSFAQGWRRAGDALSELQHFSSAIEYYEVAISLEPSLGEGELSSKLERLRVVEKIISNAENQGLGPDVVNALISDSVDSVVF